MAKNYSTNFKSTLAEVNAPESPLILLEINHPDLTTPVRIVNDSVDVTSNGNLYLAFPFRCVLPDDFENQIPKARLSVVNIGRELMYWIETTSGGQGSSCTFKQILRSNPNLIEWEISMNLYNVQVTMNEITAELGYENLFSRPAVSRQYRPNNSSGLF